jgi:CDP-4-dehydro-6-deoxyglucose reductase
MSFKIAIEPSGHTFSADEGENILDAAIRHGLSIPYGCRNGLCGVCKGKVVEGEVIYVEGKCPDGLSEAEEAIGQTLCCQALPQTDLVLEIHEVVSSNELPVHKMPARIVKMERLADDVMRLYLKIPDTERMQFLAGQYIDILLAGGRRRSFSIASAPHNDDFIELHIRLIEDGEFTGHVFNGMQEKDIVRIEGPFGSFYLREESSRPIVCIAGGTGFAPIKSVIEHAFRENIKRPIYLYWGARTQSDLYLDELVQTWRERDNFYYIPVLSQPRPEDDWQGRSGLVHQAVLTDFSDLSAYDVYISGSPVMVNAARQEFILKKLPKEQFYSDSFDFANDK